MGFEEDNRRIIEDIVNRSGELFGNIASNRGWSEPQLRAELGEENIRELEGMLANPATSKVLEIGCGQGETLRDLRKQYPHIEYHGVDIAIKKFTERLIEGVYLHEMDAQRLDFLEGRFDIVFSVIAFPFIVDKLRAIRESHRVLKPNGKGIITIDPSYFIPSGEILIPSQTQATDVFWDARKKAVIIDKKGRGTTALDREYVGCDSSSNENHYVYSVVSHYR